MAKVFQRDTDGTLLTSLVECYKLEDATGFYAGLDLTNVGGVPFVTGKLGNAASFVAASDGIYLMRSGASITVVNDNWTVCGWVNLSTALMKGVFFYVGDAATNGWGFGVGNGNLNTNGNKLIECHSNGILRMNDLGSSIGTGWHFILLERDGGTIKGYVDTVLCPSTVAGVPTAPSINTFIGAVHVPNEPTVSSRVPTALEDHFVIWNKVLSANEKADMWNGGDGNPMVEVPSALLTSQVPAGIKTAYIKTGSEKWQTLGGIKNGELKITPEVSNNTLQNNLAIGSYLFEAKFEILQTSVAELEKIDSIIDGTNSFLFRLTDAASIPASSTATEGWVTVSNSQIGVKARYLSENDPSTNQFIELLIQGSILSSEIDAVVKATIVDTDFHLSSTASGTYSDNGGIAGGTLFGYYPSTTAGSSVGVLANNKPNGFATVEIKASTDSTYLTLGRTNNCKILFDWLAQEDSCRRLIVFSIDVNIEYDLFATDSNTLRYFDTLNETETDVRITLLDGKVFTLESKLGIDITFGNRGDFDKLRKLSFKHIGNIQTTAFNGIVS